MSEPRSAGQAGLSKNLLLSQDEGDVLESSGRQRGRFTTEVIPEVENVEQESNDGDGFFSHEFAE